MNKKYARQCDITGEGMNEGYYIEEINIYIKGHFRMLQHITDSTEYSNIDEAYEDDYYSFEEWENFQYEEIDGKITKIKIK